MPQVISIYVYTEHIMGLHVYTVNNKFDNGTMTKNTYHHGDLPSALMQAALKRIAQEGVDKLSLRAVARDIGVSQTAPYRHFKDKNQLLSALAQQGFLLLTELSQAASHSDDVSRGICDIGIAYVRFAQHHPEHYKLMFGPSIPDRREDTDLMAASNQAFQVLLDKCVLGIEQGIFIDEEPCVLAHASWSRVHGMASLLIDGFYDDESLTDFDEFLQQLVWIELRGICKNMPDKNPNRSKAILFEEVAAEGSND